jgi:hypothetical protein
MKVLDYKGILLSIRLGYVMYHCHRFLDSQNEMWWNNFQFRDPQASGIQKNKLIVFERKVLRRIFGPTKKKKWYMENQNKQWIRWINPYPANVENMVSS